MNEVVLGTLATPSPARRDAALAVGSVGRRASGWVGMVATLLTEGALFAYLLFSYFYVGAQSTSPWPPDGPPQLMLATANTLILLASSGAVVLAERAMRGGRRGRALATLLVGLALGIAFAAVQGVEWSHQPFGPATHAYGSMFFLVTGFHMAHVIAGLLILAAMALWTALGLLGERRHAAFSIGALYWHFVDAVWLLVYACLYLAPHGR